jgi:hypothetical protein
MGNSRAANSYQVHIRHHQAASEQEKASKARFHEQSMPEKEDIVDEGETS